MQPDSAGNQYEEVAISGAAVRVTYVEQGWDNTPSVRIQIRDANGQLRQGPEVPLNSIGPMIGAIVTLLACAKP
jgi:hypothetical protein